jgi:hypothetical protein
MNYQPLKAETFTTAAEMIANAAATRRRLMGLPKREVVVQQPADPYEQERSRRAPAWQTSDVRFDQHVATYREYLFVKNADKAKLHVKRRSVSLGFTVEEITGPSRRRDIVAARQKIMFEVYTYFNKSLLEIGRMFGGRDHTTVLHAIRKVGGTKKPRGNPNWKAAA